MIAPHSVRFRFSLALLAAASLAAPSSAFDGGSSAPPDEEAAVTYYEDVLARQPRALDAAHAAAEGRSLGLPAALHVVPAAGGVEYRRLRRGRWRVDVEVAPRPHERVDAVYDLVLALALPADFRSDSWRIRVREGRRRASASALYAGERVTLKRNRALEASWLPTLAGAREGLPDLDGSGWVWTLWDTIVRYDAGAGRRLAGFASLAFAADPGTPEPRPGDPRSAAYLISWMPSLGAAVAPYTLRLDAAAPRQEERRRAPEP
jgi:hypothetical protein